jgi:hypothetical protein
MAAVCMCIHKCMYAHVYVGASCVSQLLFVRVCICGYMYAYMYESVRALCILAAACACMHMWIYVHVRACICANIVYVQGGLALIAPMPQFLRAL